MFSAICIPITINLCIRGKLKRVCGDWTGSSENSIQVYAQIYWLQLFSRILPIIQILAIIFCQQYSPIELANAQFHLSTIIIMINRLFISCLIHPNSREALALFVYCHSTICPRSHCEVPHERVGVQVTLSSPHRDVNFHWYFQIIYELHILPTLHSV